MWSFYRHCVLQRNVISPLNKYLPASIPKTQAWKCFHGQTRRESILEILINRLGCRQQEAQTILDNNPVLCDKPAPSLNETVMCLLSKGLSRDQVKNNLWLLTYTPALLLPRLFILSKIGYSDANLLLLKLPENKLSLIILKMSAENIVSSEQILMLAKCLQCTVGDITIYIQEQPKLLTINNRSIQELIELMREIGFSLDDIRDNLWLFSREPEHLKNRLLKIKEVEMKDVKPWHLKCAAKRFDQSFKAWLEKKNKKLQMESC